MSRTAFALLLLLATLASATTVLPGAAIASEEAAVADDAPAAPGFVEFDPAARETISGKTLMIAAYAVILGVLLLYTVLLAVRSALATRAIRRLQSRIRIPERN